MEQKFSISGTPEELQLILEKNFLFLTKKHVLQQQYLFMNRIKNKTKNS